MSTGTDKRARMVWAVCLGALAVINAMLVPLSALEGNWTAFALNVTAVPLCGGVTWLHWRDVRRPAADIGLEGE